MPNGNINFDNAGLGVRLDLAGDSYVTGVVTADATVTSYNSTTITGSGFAQDIFIAGTVISGGGAGVSMSGEEATLQIAGSGQVLSSSIYAGGAVQMTGQTSQLINQGLISGGSGIRITIPGETPEYDDIAPPVTATFVVNHGTISGNGLGTPGDPIYGDPSFAAGIYVYDDGYELSEARDPMVITNTGIISGRYTSAASPGYAIYLDSRDYSDFEEDGWAYDSQLSNVRVTIDNSGSLIGNVVLLSQDDTLDNTGLVQGDVYMGRGDDYVDSRGGEVQGTVYGEEGADTIIGGNDTDVVSGGDGNDSIVGRGDDDALSGGLGEDTLRGGSGDDSLMGGSNGDLIRGGSGDDFIDGESGTDNINGDSGDDTILGGSASDTIDGGSGEDNIDGGTSADVIFGRSGDDFIRGDSGSDTISGGSGDDTISGGTGNDSLNGGTGGDRLFSGANNDTIEGSLGDDYLSGGSGHDSLRGGSGNDTLYGGIGEDTLSGGGGADTFEFVGVSDSPHGGTRDTILDFNAGEDVIDLSGFGGLTFIGGAGYSGATGEVRYNAAVGRLYIDTDGDGGSDFSIDVGAGAGLTVDDLILS